MNDHPKKLLCKIKLRVRLSKLTKILIFPLVLGDGATISAVLYANKQHPEYKTQYLNWTDRCKQILKKWRSLSQDCKAPYLQQARDNRSALRMKKAQQVSSFYLSFFFYFLILI